MREQIPRKGFVPSGTLSRVCLKSPHMYTIVDIEYGYFNSNISAGNILLFSRERQFCAAKWLNMIPSGITHWN